MRLIPALLILFFAMVACSEKPEMPETFNLLVGTYTGSGSDGIYQLTYTTETGELAEPELVAATSNPSFLAIPADGKNVYSVGEDESGTVASWQWNNEGKLSLINEVPSYGKHPCFVDVHNDLLAVANYSSGNGGIVGLSDNGGILNAFNSYQHYGSSRNDDRQSAPHAHFSRFSKEGRFLYVIDLGIDQVLAYPITDGKLGAATTALSLEPGDGPRHLTFHPTKDQVFIINELSNTIVSATVDTTTGAFTKVDRKSTLPEGFNGESFCADIHMSNDGQFLYGSNRGHQSIAIFEVGSAATLEFLGTESTRGDWPRNFVISPDDEFLIVANQKSDNIVSFKRDKETGLLEYTGSEITVSEPVCLKFLPSNPQGQGDTKSGS